MEAVDVRDQVVIFAVLDLNVRVNAGVGTRMAAPSWPDDCDREHRFMEVS